MKTSDDKFQELFEAAPLCILVVQGEIIKYANAAFEMLVGLPHDKIVSHTFRNYVLPEDLNLVVQRHRTRLQGGNPPSDYSFGIRTSKGEIKQINTRVVLTEWEGQPATLNFITDITEELQVQRALEISEERFRLAFETSPDSININRLEDGMFVDINRGFTEMTGYTRDDCIGKTSLELNIWRDPRGRERMVKGLRASGKVNNLEARFQRKDGSVLTGLMSAAVIELDGEPHLISVTRDISGLKHAEYERTNLQQQLQQAQKMEAIGTLAGGIAHDFNNILAAVIGYTEITLQKMKQGNAGPAELIKALGAAGRAKQLVQQILTFSRKSGTGFSPLDIKTVINEAMELIKQTLPKMISINLHLADDLGPIQGNAVQLEQVIINLCSNARDAMPDGGMLTISAEYINAQSLLCAACGANFSGEYISTTIADTGQGMDDKTRAKIFDPFFTTKEVGKGTGLGLSTVYGIVNSHQGHIVCQSSLGQGASFQVFLPYSPGARIGKAAGDEDTPIETAGSETILLVDDETMLREIGAEMLSTVGYRPLLAETGEQALEMYREQGPEIDLVILDLSMPGMGGQKCLKKLKELDPEVKVLIASGYNLQGQDEKDVISQASGFLSKPFKHSELLEVLRSVLDQRHRS